MYFHEDDPAPYFLSGNAICYLGKDSVSEVAGLPERWNNSHRGYNHLTMDDKGQMYCSFSSPLHKTTNGRATVIHYKHPNQRTWPKDITTDREGNIWVSSERGVIKLRYSSFRDYSTQDGLLEDEVSAILQLSSGAMLIGSNESYAYLKDGELSCYQVSMSERLGSTRVIGFFETADGRVFSASNHKGLGIWDGKGEPQFAWHTVDGDDYRHIWHVFSLYGNDYAVSGNNLHKIDPVTGQLSLAAISNSLMRKVEVLNDSAFVLGDDLGLYNGAHFSQYARNPAGTKQSLYGICEWKGKKLVATRHGLQYVSGDSLAPFWVHGRAINHSVFALLKDSRNCLWVGTSRGVFHIDDTTVRTYNQRNGLIGNEVNRGR
jgi:ligand-binding sensor domain-containing protein